VAIEAEIKATGGDWGDRMWIYVAQSVDATSHLNQDYKVRDFAQRAT
jgi:hypothetical protein